MSKQTVNKTLLLGTLGQDPELKYTKTGKAVTTLSVATKDGLKGTTTNWHKVVVWGKLAENCREYLSKGSEVFVEGELSYRSYENKEGKKVYVTEIVARDVKFMSKKSDTLEETSDPVVADPGVDEDVPF